MSMADRAVRSIGVIGWGESGAVERGWGELGVIRYLNVGDWEAPMVGASAAAVIGAGAVVAMGAITNA